VSTSARNSGIIIMTGRRCIY